MKNQPHAPASDDCLDTAGLNRLEQAFRDWAAASRPDVRLARRRILLIFLLIRYTGAKLHEVLTLVPGQDFDFQRHTVCFHDRAEGGQGLSEGREVQIAEGLSQEIRELLSYPAPEKVGEFVAGKNASGGLGAGMPAVRVSAPGKSKNGQPLFDPSFSPFDADPGFVRRKFYERAEACGFAKQLGGPEKIRKARAVEMMQNNIPLPVVQTVLGHSTSNLTSSYLSFSAEEIRHITRFFMDKEARRQTSARNSFFGKIKRIVKGDVQACVELATIEGHTVTTTITTASLSRLGLRPGALATAEVKAPWVLVQKSDDVPRCSAENCFQGEISRVSQGRINTECAVRISETTELCAIVSTAGYKALNVREGDRVWAFFNSSAVILHVE